MRARLAVCCSLSLLAACARDASLPPPPAPPGPGSIQGRVVYAIAGQSQRVAAAGAQVTVLGTALAAVTGPDGRFYIGNVTQTDGLLLLQASTDGGATPNRQAVISLADIRAGPGRDIALGDVPVVENATVRGRVTLADVGTPGGHAGTLVFVPQGPFMTQTADDGSYTLPELPAGTVTLSFFRDRYASDMIDGMVLTAGQSYTVRDIVLQPVVAGPDAPGTIAGTVTASGGAVASAAVSARSATGANLGPVNPDAGGAFSLSAPPGVYSVSVALAGFEPALVGNVLVGSATTVELALALTPTASTCTAGLSCSSGCTVGQVTCPAGAGGAITCSPTGFVMNGTPCGAGLTCQAGSCVSACTPGVACQVTSVLDPSRACHVAAVSCASGAPVCEEAAPVQLLPAGTTCGPFQVCSASGACVACAAGTACAVAGSPCHAGAYDCRTGAPVCVDTGAPLAAGTACGAGQVCDASGACLACQAGALCTPANPCHAGAVSCATGAAVCGDTGAPSLDGSVCGTDLVCHGGACGPCVVAAACDGAAGHAAPPAAADPCKAYATACATGLPVCAAAASLPDNTPCGTGLVCRSGLCATPGNGLRVATAPGALHALPNQPLAVTLQLVDVLAAPVLTPDTVTIAPPPGAQAPAPAATSATDGTVTFTITLGRAVGPQTFRATAPSLYAPLDFVVTADAPADGTLVPLAGAAHVFGYSSVSGPAPGLPVAYPFGIAVASDGTVFFADSWHCAVKRIAPSGALDLVAGSGSCGFNGETGAALAVNLAYPQGLALDEPRNRLYIADTNNNRVRVVDLTGGMLATVAGDGTTGTADPYGDGGPALSAQLYSPQAVAVGPESPPALYVADGYHSRVRRVDPATHVITTVAKPAAACLNTGPLAIGDMYGTIRGSLAFDEKGSLFLSARFCGGPANGYYAEGVARLEPDGSLTLVAGTAAGVLSNGVPATSVQFGDLPLLAFDSAPAAGGGRRSNLYVSVPNDYLVGRVDGATGRFDLVLGTGVLGKTGDFGPAAAATRDRLGAIAIGPGTRDLYVAEGYTNSVSMVAGAGAAAASSVSLAAVTPLAVSALPSQPLAAPLNVVLTDGGGAPLSGYPVAFSLAGPPGAWIASGSGSTALDGIAGVAARPGLALDHYGVVASFLDLHGDHASGSPVAFDVQAVAPPAGTVFAAVNQSHVGGLSGVPGPGAVARVSQPRGIALHPNGTVYFSDVNYRIFALAPSGLVSVVGGDGSYYTVADGGPATASGMEPWGLAIDDAAGQLYFADQYNDRVRRIDLASGFVYTVAGGGASNADGPALDTTLNAPSRVRLVGKMLYLSDRTSTADRLRRVDVTNVVADPASAPIETYLPNRTPRALPAPGDLVASCVGSGPYVFWACGNDPGCSVAAAPDGRLYVSGSFCGSGTVTPATTSAISPVFGIARVEADGSLTRVAGVRPNGLFDGQTAGNSGFDAPPSLATDAAGNLWVTKRGSGAAEQKVGWFQATAGVVDATSLFHLVGTGPVGVEYVDASATSFSSPTDVAVGAHAFVADGGVDAVRVVW